MCSGCGKLHYAVQAETKYGEVLSGSANLRNRMPNEFFKVQNIQVCQMADLSSRLKRYHMLTV